MGTDAQDRPGVAERGESEFDRGLSFYDAIYGFAATLLVANVDAPAPEAWQSLRTLFTDDVVDQLLGFVISFVVIVVFWRVNVTLVRRLSGLDGPTTAVNLATAGLVILLPFTTEGISDAATTDLPLPTAIYAVNVAAVALAQVAMFQVARSRGLERNPIPSRLNRIQLLDALVVPLYFLASVPVALVVSADAARLSWLGLIVVAPVSGRLVRVASRRQPAASAPSAS
ncbi:TMEM175 family protein [Microbacterium sp. NPDC055357]